MLVYMWNARVSYFATVCQKFVLRAFYMIRAFAAFFLRDS
jgi:hypothetical protein